MIKKFAGYLLVVIGFIGLVFFKNYQGSVIPIPSFWFLVSILVVIVGFYILYSSSKGKNSTQEKYNEERLEKLKQNGNKILLTADNCEVRENSYHEVVEQNGYSSITVADAIYDPNRNHKEQFIIQSAIIYHYPDAGKKIRMVSQSFPFSKKVLEDCIDKKLLTLYVNRFDKNDYLFDARL